MTQFGRAMNDLNIEILCANSSEAKGRVEQANRTLQDRLVKELRLAGISDMEAINAFLSGFMERYNSRFAKVPVPQARRSGWARRPARKAHGLGREKARSTPVGSPHRGPSMARLGGRVGFSRHLARLSLAIIPARRQVATGGWKNML
jgi:hypothetical protein